MKREESDEFSESARFMRGANEGLSDIKEGRVYEHDEVMAEMKKRYGGSPRDGLFRTSDSRQSM